MNLYLLIALVVISFWLVSFGIYLVISNRQRDVEDELNNLSKRLQEDGID